MKLEERNRAIKLRKSGFGYPGILKRVNVSKSTLSYWLRGVELTPNQKGRLLKGRERSRFAAAEARRRKRLEKTEEIIFAGRKEFPLLLKNQLFLSGLSLYWAEGDKNKSEKTYTSLLEFGANLDTPHLPACGLHRSSCGAI